MADVSVAFAVGSEQVTVVLPVDLPTDGETIITGDFAGVVAAGTVARLRGSVNLTGSMHVRGTLLCDPTGVDLNGNGFDIHTHDGTLNLVGQEKTAWLHWGDTPVGWMVGDRLAVAPTVPNVYTPTETTWQGSWATTMRPVNSPDRTLTGGTIAKPEVVNLSQTVTLRNMQRIMIHEASGPNPQTLKWIRVLNSGETGILGMYPIHFHMIGDHARGSLLEGVVVEGGKNHAFVPHGSNGITQTGCVAYNTTGVAYWWDKTANNPANNSHDIHWDNCLSMWSKSSTMPGENTGLAGFQLGAGTGCTCVGSVATCIPASGNNQRSGFLWAENANLKPWDFRDCLAHNSGDNGIFTWQNTDELHFIEDFVAYNCGDAGVSHGAYVNQYRYSRMVLSNCGFAVKQNAKTRQNQPNRLLFEDIVTDGHLWVAHHNSDHMLPTIYRRCSFTFVLYQGETENGSLNRYEDCGLVPADFNFTGASPATIAEIYEGGVLIYRWQSGVWS